MRWKLLVLVSIAAGILGMGLWSALSMVFGSAAGWISVASGLVPVGTSIYAAIFVYRHTSRRRKTQAMLTAILSLMLTTLSYVIAAKFFPEKLLLPRIDVLRHAR